MNEHGKLHILGLQAACLHYMFEKFGPNRHDLRTLPENDTFACNTDHTRIYEQEDGREDRTALPTSKVVSHMTYHRGQYIFTPCNNFFERVCLFFSLSGHR